MSSVSAVIDGVIGQSPTEHERVRRKRPSMRDQLLPVLHAIQDRFGCVDRSALTELAERLDVPLAEAYGVATFYELLNVAEDGQSIVAHVCDDIVCRRLDPIEAPPGATVHPSPCLGQCDRGVAAYIHTAGAAVSRAVIHNGAGEPALGSIGPARLLARVGTSASGSLEAYLDSGGFTALSAARELGADAVLDLLDRSGLRGRGGAAFPTGAKWRAVANSPVSERYVVCNADESEPGTFKDRVLMEGDPFGLIESLAIAMFTVAAQRGYIYIRGEYPDAEAAVQHGLAEATAAGHLDLGSGLLEIQIRRGGGAYICGEETALFNSIEGYRGEPRSKPPYPTESGLFGKPTVVNNVETLLNVPHLLVDPETPESKLFCVSGDVGRPGTYEVPFGTPLGAVLDLAGGVEGDLRAVLLGGAAGSFVGPDRLDLPLSFEAAREAGLSLGSGVLIALNTTADIEDLLIRTSQFFRDESCGQCVPCRVGTVRQHEVMLSGRRDRALLDDLAAVMTDASICGLGHTASTALQSALDMGLIASEDGP
jgi:NADH-quinone oxidoreductase subunit F